MLLVNSLLIAAILAVEPAVSSAIDQPKTDRPATVAEAAKVIDMATFPMMDGAKPTERRRLASLDYVAKGDPRGAYAFQKKTLEARGWKELPGGSLSDQSCFGAFGKEGFTVSVMTSPSHGPESAGMVAVRMINHGNVDLSKLPVPADTKPLYSFPSVTAYVTETPAKQTGEALRTLLTAQGWQPYGSAGDSQDFKQNAVKLSAWSRAAPGQGGKTVIQLSSELLSVDLPAPPALLRAQYADSTKALSIDVDMTSDSLAAFYREALGKAGWKATTDKPFKEDFHEMMIFRNDANDIAILSMHRFEGILRAYLKHQTGAEFDEEVQRARAEEAKRKAEAARYAKMAAEEAARNVVTVEIAAPAGAKDVKRTEDSLEFKLPAGIARTTVETIRADLIGKGWKAARSSLSQDSGTVHLEKKADVSLSIIYIDTGLDDASVTISAFGPKIKEPKAK
jgi:hypothetical protein